MVDVTRTVIRLGNFSDGIPDIDPDGTGAAENSNALVGETFTSATMSIETVTYSDGNNDGFVTFDGTVSPTGEYITYDLGSGPVSEPIDQGVWYNLTFTLVGGATFSQNALIFQTPSGETFLTEFASSLDNLDIASITPTAVFNDLFVRTSTANSVDNTTVCFGPGTMIMAPGGPRPVDDFAPGDLVWTMDAEPRPVVAVYRVTADADGAGNPIRFQPGSLGPGMPQQRLHLTGNHRVLCASKLVRRMFDADRVLIPAKRFAGCGGIGADPMAGKVQFFHLELAEHAVLWANGALVESCLLGPVALAGLPQAFAQAKRVRPAPQPCLPVPPGHKQRKFVERLIKNDGKVVDLTFLPEFKPGAHGEVLMANA